MLVLKNIPYSNQKTDPALSNQQAADIINIGEVVFEELGRLYIFDTKTLQRKLLPIPALNSKSHKEQKFIGGNIPSYLNFSPDGRYLYFAYNNEDFYIFDFQNQTYKVLYKLGPNASVDSFSPNRRYAVVDTGCCPGDSGKTLISLNGKVLKQITGSDLIWSPNGSRFAIAKGEFELPLALAPAPKNSSIYLEEIQNEIVKEKVLIEATNQFHFLPIKWLDDLTLVYEKHTYSQPFPYFKDITEEINNRWLEVYGSPTISYWKINVTTGVKEEFISFNKTVDKKTQREIVRNGWRLEFEGDTYPKTIYLVMENDPPTKTIIGTGYEALWRPNPIYNSTQDWKTYTNSQYKFSFSYPSNFAVDEVMYSSSISIINRRFYAKVEIITNEYSTTSYDSNRQKFIDFARGKVSDRCTADGPPDAWDRCKKIIKETPVNVNEISGYEFLLNQEVKKTDIPESENRVIGPVFILDISKQTNNTAIALILAVNLFDVTNKDDEKQLRDILSTLKFIQ